MGSGIQGSFLPVICPPPPPLPRQAVITLLQTVHLRAIGEKAQRLVQQRRGRGRSGGTLPLLLPATLMAGRLAAAAGALESMAATTAATTGV